MPEEMIRKRVEKTLPSMELIENLADEFETTLTATAIRYVDLSEEQCALVFSTDGRIVWSHRSSEFRRWIAPGRKVSPNSCAIDFFESGILPGECERFAGMLGWKYFRT